jgi:hypothetical protein
MALQRYKSQIVRCLGHQDPSIRRRALDVISALIDETNAESLIPEIIVYLKLADSDFRAELVAKIYAAIQKFGRNCQWNFDVVHQMLVDSGNYASMEIVSSFCELIATSPSIHQHAVEKLKESMVNFSENQTLMQVASFVIGEFAIFDNGAVAALAHIVTLPQTSAESQMYAVMALAKMATRFNQKEKALDVFGKLVTSNNLEVQQRAGELAKLLTHADVCDVVLAPIEERDEAAAQAPKIVMEPTANPKQVDTVLGDLLLELDDAPKPEPQQQATTQSLLSDLLQKPQQPQKPVQVQSPSQPQIQQPPAQPSKPVQVQPQRPAQVQAPTVQGIELLRKGDYVICGRALGNPSDPRQVALNLLVYGTGATALTEFKMEFNPTPGWRLSVKPADKPMVPPAGQGALSQTLYLMNMNNSPFQLHIKTSYRYGAQPFSELGTVTRLPPI